ncbi:MAG: sugar phosphate nucleotidyltransferase [Candidatus Gastranaerophilales bacterium]|nr:sugar phosphate nucleotidyltransferase [Candidatus Gastranaerophilales bacterium]MCM1073733.1 sugar phosphate nucleotidyltransferase [Bacteroides sp.]
MKYKGIILAAGNGTRLYPASLATSKILLPVYDKPMIYYPLSTLISAGISDILIISNEKYVNNFKELLGNGEKFGVNIEYEIQYKPRGVAESFLIAKDFIGDDNVVLILGDNIFYGADFSKKLRNAIQENINATIFGYYVNNPEKFGVLEFNKDFEVTSIEEKPLFPKSHYAAVGLYVYDNKVVEFAENLTPSSRNELEITDINKIYLKNKELKVCILDENVYWQDAGSFEGLLGTSLFIKEAEEKYNKKIGCVEEAAIEAGFVPQTDIFSSDLNDYYNYVSNIVE